MLRAPLHCAPSAHVASCDSALNLILILILSFVPHTSPSLSHTSVLSRSSLTHSRSTLVLVHPTHPASTQLHHCALDACAFASASPLVCDCVQDTELLPSTEDSSSLHVVVHRAFDVRSGPGAMRGGAPTHSFADPLGSQNASAPAASSSLPSPGAPPLLSARFVFDDYIVCVGTTTRTSATRS